VLIVSLSEESSADYAVVDVKSGEEWLTSRLYLVASLAARMRGIRAIVFVASAGVKSTYLGIVGIAPLRWALGAEYPWLELAYTQACGAAFAQPTAHDVASNPRSESFVCRYWFCCPETGKRAAKLFSRGAAIGSSVGKPTGWAMPASARLGATGLSARHAGYIARLGAPAMR
jgi:hypothetical protein